MNLKQACETMDEDDYIIRIPKMIKWLHGNLEDLDKAYIDFSWFKDKDKAIEQVKRFMIYSPLDICVITNDWKKVRVERDEDWEKKQIQRNKDSV